MKSYLHSKSASWVLLAVSLISGFLIYNIITLNVFGLSFSLFTLLWVLCICAVGYAKNRASSGLLFCLTIALINGAMVSLRDNGFVQFVAAMTVLILGGHALLAVHLSNITSLSYVMRLMAFIQSTVIGFLGGFFALLKPLVPKQIVKNVDTQATKSRFKAVVLAMLVGFLFIALFASADDVVRDSFSWLSTLIDNIVRFLESIDVFSSKLVPILFYSFVSLTLLSVLVANRDVSAADSSMPTVPKMDALARKLVVGVTTTCFVFFSLIQLGYLFFQVGLPEGISYAEYARQGYGQLLLAVIIGAGLVYLLNRPSQLAKGESNSFVKQMSYVLLGSIIFVVLSAWKRLVMYENAYGLSITRIVAHLGLVCIVLGVISLTFWLKGRISRPQLFAHGWVYVSLAATVFGLMNPAALIARTNIGQMGRAEEGLDIRYLISLGADTWPVLCNNRSKLLANEKTAGVLQYYPYSSVSEYNGALADPFYAGNLLTGPRLITDSQKQNTGLGQNITHSLAYRNKFENCFRQISW